MKKILVILIISLCVAIYIMTKNDNKTAKEYEYVCFEKDIKTNDLINENNIKYCTTNNELPLDVIIDKNALISDEYNYIYIGDNKSANEFIYEDEIVKQNKNNISPIELTNEFKFLFHGSSTNQGKEINIFIKDGKVYAKDNHYTKILFDSEEAVKIGKRGICCGGENRLIILTKNNNLYISERDLSYNFDYDYFKVIKLDVSNVKEIFLIELNINDIQKHLFIKDINGEEIIIDDMKSYVRKK